MTDWQETYRLVDEAWRIRRLEFYHDNRRAILTISRFSGIHISRITTKLWSKSKRLWID